MKRYITHTYTLCITPPVWGGWGCSRDLTKQEIKFPYLGTTDKIKSPLTNGKGLAFSTND